MPVNKTHTARLLEKAVGSIQAQQISMQRAHTNSSNSNASSNHISEAKESLNRIVSNLRFGSGANSESLNRSADQYLKKAGLDSYTEHSQQSIYGPSAKKLEELFSADGQNSLQHSLRAMYAELKDLNTAKQNGFLASNKLVQNLQTKLSKLAEFQEHVQAKLAKEVEETNQILSNLADLNTQIRENRTLGKSASGEILKREQTLEKLARKLAFSSYEQADGSIEIQLKGGFTILNSNGAKKLDLHDKPSFTNRTTPTLAGNNLKFIVYDFSAGQNSGHINLTDRIALSGGTLGALLSVRGVANANSASPFDASGTIPNFANRLESFSQTLVNEFNPALSNNVKEQALFSLNDSTATSTNSTTQRLKIARDSSVNLEPLEDSYIANKKFSFGINKHYSFNGTLQAQLNEISNSATQFNLSNLQDKNISELKFAVIDHHSSVTANLQPNQEYSYNLAYQAKLEQAGFSLGRGTQLLDNVLSTL